MISIPSHLRTVLDSVKGVRRNGAGYMAICPAHDDHNPSLSIKVGDTGKVVLRCFAGCTFEQVLSACGLTSDDLCDTRQLSTARNAPDRPTLSRKSQSPGTGANAPTAVYVYEDYDGLPLYRVGRWNKPGGGKRFQMERYDGSGGWLPKAGDVRRVLYRLPEVARAIEEGRRIYVVEGEKNADDLARLGLTATTNPNGAGKWKTYGDGYTEALRGADVVILYDNDNPGRRHRDEVARCLSGVARSVRVVDLPGVGEAEDVSDWLDAGGTLDELEQLADAAPEWTPGANARQRAMVIRASEVQPEKVEWLWRGYLPRGKIVIVDGDPGLAKSTVLLDLAARISTGRELPDGQALSAPADVLLLSGEDGVADTIIPRLIAAEADRERIHILQWVDSLRGKRTPILPEDIPELKRILIETKAVLLVVDPFMAFLSPEIDSHRDQGVRQAMTPLKELAEETGAAIVVLRHCSKGVGLSAIHKGGGSIAFIGAARLGILFAKDPDAPPKSGRVVMAVTKSNLGPIPPALAYHTETDSELGCGRVVWEGTTNHVADDLTGLPMSADERGAVAEAREFLISMISDCAMPVKELRQAATEAGISSSSLRRAKESLTVRSIYDGKGKLWSWSLVPLPSCESERPEGELSPEQDDQEAIPRAM